MLKSELDTPSLILDIDIFEENLKKMRDFALAHGKKLRPHAKTHKCPEIAKRQLACGNCIGICAAKLSEAEGLAAAGIQDILITSPVTAPWKMKRVMELNQKIANLQVTVDNVEQIKMLAELAVDKKLHVLIDVDPEMGRTGVAYNEALSFGRFINGFSSLVLDGVQCYAGHLQHIVSAEERAAASTYLMQKGAEVFNVLKQEIPTCRIFTGTGTGTSAADVLIDEVTDIQVGSYCMMDAEYLAVEHQEVQYRPALRMLSSVISANHSGNATIDAGTKAIYVTPGAPPQRNSLVRPTALTTVSNSAIVYSFSFVSSLARPSSNVSSSPVRTRRALLKIIISVLPAWNTAAQIGLMAPMTERIIPPKTNSIPKSRF